MLFEVLETKRLKLRKLDQVVFDFIFNNYALDELQSFLALQSQEEVEIEKEKYRKGFSTFNKTFLYFQLIEK